MDTESRLKVGIFFNARPEQGGLYQYALTLTDCLYQFVPEYDYRLYHATLEDLPLKIKAANWRIVELQPRDVQLRMGIEWLLMVIARGGLEISKQMIPDYGEIQRDPPDVMIYVKPTLHIFQWGYQAIFPIHDLQHRLHPEFPEVSQHGEYRRREFMYTRSIPNAAAILTDSETGKEDVLACYHSEARKIFPLPYIAPTFRAELMDFELMSSIRKKYDLPVGYLFYPAAFWAHKNHLRLVRAVGLIAKEKEVRIPLVLTGSKREGYEDVVTLVHELGLDDIVHFTGYVPEEDILTLYRQALALVMPTFFGPTNIPVLEAWASGCAVITSDLRGIREHVGDAGLLVDPRDETALANAIWRLHENPELRQDLIERGKIRAAQWTPQLFAHRLAEVIAFAVQ